MAGLFDFSHKDRDKDFENLPPLVPEGSSVEERDRIIADIVAVWSAPLPVMSELESGGLPSNGVTLDRVNLYDAERGEAINLGDLLKQVQDRIVDLSKKDQRRCVITLRGCRIESCKVKELEMLCSLKILACYFGDGVFFGEASFGVRADFEGTSFGEGAIFKGTSFYERADFERASFGAGAVFWGARLVGGAFFGGASFGKGASFRGTSFDERADFEGASFGDMTSFWNASFASSAGFQSAVFGERGLFVGASFAEGADFEGASFGESAYFRNTSFGEGTYFGGANFGEGANFDGANFGEGAIFWKASLLNASFNYVAADGIDFSGARIGCVSEPNPNLAHWKRLFSFSTEWLMRRWRIYDWAVVRSISELQILTRVSYLALIIVPLLAGTWPAVRVMVNKYNNAITEASAQFEEASQKLDAVSSQLNPTPPNSEGEADDALLTQNLSETLKKLNQIDSQAEEWIENYGPKTIERPEMPDVFAFSFFAALFVVLGHLVYQIASPELIRPRSRRQYMRESLEGFDERAGDRDLRLRKAMQRLKDAQDRMPWNRHQNFVHRDGDTVWVPTEMERFILKPQKNNAAQTHEGKQPEEPAEQPEAPNTETASEEYDSTLMRVTIEEGAKAEYDVEARENLRAAWGSGVCYLIATILIGWIVVSQSMNIGDAAGWWDSPLIEHTTSQ